MGGDGQTLHWQAHKRCTCTQTCGLRPSWPAAANHRWEAVTQLRDHGCCCGHGSRPPVIVPPHPPPQLHLELPAVHHDTAHRGRGGAQGRRGGVPDCRAGGPAAGGTGENQYPCPGHSRQATRHSSPHPPPASPCTQQRPIPRTPTRSLLPSRPCIAPCAVLLRRACGLQGPSA